MRAGSGTPRPRIAQAHGVEAPTAAAAITDPSESVAVIRIPNPRISARRRAMVNGACESIQGTGVQLSIRVDIGHETERLFAFQEDMVLQHKAVHVGRHETA